MSDIAEYSALLAVARAAQTLLDDSEIVSKDGLRQVGADSAKRLEERLAALGFDPLCIDGQEAT